MCGGHGNSEGKVPSLTESESSSKKGLTSDASQDSSFLLLELASKNDLEKFQQCVEKEGLNRIDNVGTWYVGMNGSRKMCVERRTPAMIAALYGSLDVLKYIVKEVYMAYCRDINQTCGSDGTTALHCAVAGGSTFAVETTKFLVESGADVNVIDAMGRTAADMINVSYRPGNVKRKALEEILARKPTNGLPSLTQKHVTRWSLFTARHGSSISVHHKINPIFLNKISYQLGPWLVSLKHTSKECHYLHHHMFIYVLSSHPTKSFGSTNMLPCNPKQGPKFPSLE